MPITSSNPFNGTPFPGEVLLVCVRWYLRYPLAYEHVAELLAEHGVEADSSCICRWCRPTHPSRWSHGSKSQPATKSKMIASGTLYAFRCFASGAQMDVAARPRFVASAGARVYSSRCARGACVDGAPTGTLPDLARDCRSHGSLAVDGNRGRLGGLRHDSGERRP